MMTRYIYFFLHNAALKKWKQDKKPQVHQNLRDMFVSKTDSTEMYEKGINETKH